MQTRSLAAAVAVVALLGSTAATSTSTPDDPLFPQQWGPHQVRAPEVWPVTSGDGALIAIVDTGVDGTHEDLRANVVGGNTFLDCGENGCGNGDWRSGGQEGDPHGTHVAGIAAAVGDNGTGIVGIAPDAGILPVRVLDAAGSGTFTDIGFGIRYAADRGADVINLSLGAPPGVQALEITGLVTDARDAIVYARERGAVVVVAAGNEAFPLCGSPSFNDGALCVVATDNRELRSAYSNDAIKPDLKALAAPGGSAVPFCGEDVLSTVPAGEGTDACGYPSNLAYDEIAGTSMAAPHVSGVAALLASLGCTNTEIEDVLLATARNPIDGSTGTWDPFYGYGIVDAAAAVAAASCTTTGPGGGDDGPAPDPHDGDEGEKGEGEDEGKNEDKGKKEKDGKDEAEDESEEENEDGQDHGEDESEEEEGEEEEEEEEEDGGEPGRRPTGGYLQRR